MRQIGPRVRLHHEQISSRISGLNITMAIIVVMVALIIWIQVVDALRPTVIHRRGESRAGCSTTRLPSSSDPALGPDESNTNVGIGTIASLGALETGFLSYNKLNGGTVDGSLLCQSPGSSSSCQDVLSGPYSMIPGLNIPLVTIAFLVYSCVAFLALTNTDNADGDKKEATLFLTTAMATFSGYLMIVLTTVLHTSCQYCYLSAALSVGMAVLAWNNRIVENPTKAAVVKLSSASIAALSSAFLFYATSLTMDPPDVAQASTAPAFQAMMQAAEAKKAEQELNSMARQAPAPSTARTAADALKQKGPFSPPLIKGHSSDRALAIGKRLQGKGAKMYGAYWCSHCNNQKQELGYEVVKEKQMFTYIECDKEGLNSQYNMCKANKKNIPGYPTWEISGEYFPGEQSLDELEKLLDRADRLEKNPNLADLAKN